MVDENNQNSPPSGDENQNDQNQIDDDQGGEDQEDIAERGKGRNVQGRIDELTSKIYQLETDLARAKQTPPPPPPPPTTPLKPETQQAIEYLKELGFTRKEDVASQMQAIEDRMALNNEHSR